jgi:Zn-dependent protease
MMWVALAGPLSNFLMALLAALPFRLNLVTLDDLFLSFATQGSSILPTPTEFLWEFITINLVLMLFNLIPIPPLDGDKIAEFFLPSTWKDRMAQIRPYGPMILIVLFMVGPYLGINVFSWILGPPLRFLINLLVG